MDPHSPPPPPPPPLRFAASDWRPLISATLEKVWPELAHGALWIEAQVAQESGGNPKALSGHGAMGLLQLMPATAKELGVADPYEPGENLDGGIRYLRIQYNHLAEIPEHIDRLRWSFACYNGGRGYVNQALVLARRDDPRWHRWDIGHFWLMHKDCIVHGRRPDYKQIWNYVERISQGFRYRTGLL